MVLHSVVENDIEGNSRWDVIKFAIPRFEPQATHDDTMTSHLNLLHHLDSNAIILKNIKCLTKHGINHMMFICFMSSSNKI